MKVTYTQKLIKSRPCNFHLIFDSSEGMSMSDWIIEDEQLKMLLISHDGAGCCDCKQKGILFMNKKDSQILLGLIESKNFSDEFFKIIENYFLANLTCLWDDVLIKH